MTPAWLPADGISTSTVKVTVTDTTVVPEPLTVFGVMLGVGGLARYVRRRVVG